MAEQKEAVRASVASSLTSILGPDQMARRVAEEELKALEVTEGLLDHTHLINIGVAVVSVFVWCRIWCSPGRDDSLSSYTCGIQAGELTSLTTPYPSGTVVI